jgi:D-alanyl-D-alanine dipeptidase
MLIDRQLTMHGAAESTTMHVLDRTSAATSFLVRPRWPYDKVLISDEALRRLMAAQSTLSDHGLTLVLTRGYESRGRLIRVAHRLGRAAGMVLFCLVYPHRHRERRAIFSPNGHDRSGDCIDVALVHRGEMLTLLPLGVFTPRWLIRRAQRMHQRELTLAWSALASAGLRVHDNPTEAMQIHCEVRG